MRRSLSLRVSIIHLCVVFVLLLITAALPACALFGQSKAPANPFAVCKSVGQCYLAAAGTYNASQKAALELLASPTTPDSVKAALRAADEAATPQVENLSAAYRVYRHAKADLAAGTGSADKVSIATADVNKWLTEAGPLILKLSALAGQ